MQYLAALNKFFLNFFWIILSSVLVWIYFPLLRHDPVMKRDDVPLLTPLAGITSWREFLGYLTSFRNPDVQPIRDISYMIDISLTRVLGFGLIHIDNLCLWIICCALVMALMRRILKEEIYVKAWGFLFAIHPVYSMTVSWISARKHLLSFLFLLAALNALHALFSSEDKKKIAWSAAALTVFYLCSLLSQPINILLPLWIALLLGISPEARSWARRHKLAISSLLTALGITLITLLAINYHHYEIFYKNFEPLKDGKLSSLQPLSMNPPGIALLALGRYFYQLVMPTTYSLISSPGSLENMIGLVLFPLFGVSCWKMIGRRKTILGLSFFAVMLALVLAKIQSLFTCDAYLLSASLGIWYLALELWRKLSTGNQKTRNRLNGPLWLVMALFFVYRSTAEAENWLSNPKIWGASFAREPNCHVAEGYAFLLYEMGPTNEAVKPTQFYFRNQCRSQASLLLSYLTVYYQSDLPEAKKIDLLSRPPETDITCGAILAALYVKNHEWKKANEKISYLIEHEPRFLQLMPKVNTKPLREELKAVCPNQNLRHCNLTR